MSEAPRSASKKTKLLAALTFLGFSGWIALAPMLEGLSEPKAEVETETTDEVFVYGGPISDEDLLRVHGSFEPGPVPIQDPFVWLGEGEPDPAPGAGGAPVVHHEARRTTEEGGEPEASGEGEEEEIPQLNVTLVFRTGKASRAVVDGSIVGVGDLTRAGEILEIQDQGIRMSWKGKKLFFPLSPR